MEFEDHQEPHEGDIEMGPSYDSINNSNSNSNSTRPSKISTQIAIIDAEPQSQRNPRYRECLKNHAVGIGAHAVDGCGEFLPAGPDGTLDALKCAACNCHRNFHRKESLAAAAGAGALVGAGFADPFHHSPTPLLTHYPHVHHQQQQQQVSPTAYFRAMPVAVGAAPAGYLHVAQRPVPLALPSTSGGGNEQEGMNSGGEGSASKKRHRTKFTAEQKERMVGFAEGLGWRIQKQDEEMVQNFCNENGLKRHVLKVWMHNNKHTIGKKP